MSLPETIWWCVEHQSPSTEADDECLIAYEYPVRSACRTVERVLSLPGELIDPANVDYDAATRVMRSWLVEDNDAPLLSAVRWAVDAALGVRKPVEGNGE